LTIGLRSVAAGRQRSRAILATLVALSLPVAVVAGDLRTTQRPIPGQYIVVLKREVVQRFDGPPLVQAPPLEASDRSARQHAHEAGPARPPQS
jgi:hypothetical protein